MYLVQFKSWLLSALWSSIHHQRILRDTREQRHKDTGGKLYIHTHTQLHSGEDVRHSDSNREQEKETGENEWLRESKSIREAVNINE